MVVIFKRFFILVAMLAVSNLYGSVYVKGHVNKNGKYIKPYYKTSPNKTKQDNWSSKNQVNPYTGEKGTNK